MEYLLDIGLSPNCTIPDEKYRDHPTEHSLIQIASMVINNIKYPKARPRRLKDVAKMLLEKGANPNHRLDSASLTCLHYAAANG